MSRELIVSILTEGVMTEEGIEQVSITLGSVSGILNRTISSHDTIFCNEMVWCNWNV